MRTLWFVLLFTVSGCAMPMCETTVDTGVTAKPCLGMCEFPDRRPESAPRPYPQIAVMDEDATGTVTCEKVTAVRGMIQRQ
jgi:hypothetical protein